MSTPPPAPRYPALPPPPPPPGRAALRLRHPHRPARPRDALGPRPPRAAACCGAPLAGLAVGAARPRLGLLLLFLGAGPLLAAVVTVAVPAVLTRGLHLDGLADAADGLGSGKPAEDALRVMKQSDIGPFGVLTLVLVLLAQVAALAELYGDALGAGARRRRRLRPHRPPAPHPGRPPGVPAARPEGLGAAVAGTVPPRGAGAVAAVVAVDGRGGRGLASSARFGAVRTPSRSCSAWPPRSCCCGTAAPLRRRHGRRVRRARGDRGHGGAAGGPLG